MSPNNEQSAEFCRGAVWMARMLGDESGEAQYSALLAEAEAREGGVPSAAEVTVAMSAACTSRGLASAPNPEQVLSLAISRLLQVQAG